MAKINESERVSQNRVIQFFQDPQILGYTYYGNLQYQINKNIMTERS
jgi:type I restriction enzyme R subunit